MSAQQPFNPRLVVGLIAAGVVAFGAMLLLLAYGGGAGSSQTGRANPLSIAATGFKGLVTLLEDYYDTRLVRAAGDERDGLLIVTIEERTRPDLVARMLERRRNLPTLLILPKWVTMGDPVRRGWVQAVVPAAGAAAEPALGELDAQVGVERGRPPAFVAGEDALAGMRLPVPASPQTIVGKGLRPLAALPGGGALIVRIGEEPHFILADPDLLNNHGLKDPDRALAAFSLIERLNGEGENVDFDLTANGLGSAGGPSVLRLAFEPPFLVMTLALVAAALLAGLHGAFRFGPARAEARSIALGKTALVENSAGLIRLAEREARLGAAYADVVRQETARTTGAPAALQGADLDAYLNRLGKPDRPTFTELAARLAAARDRHALMAAARALSQWKKEIIR